MLTFFRAAGSGLDTGEAHLRLASGAYLFRRAGARLATRAFKPGESVEEAPDCPLEEASNSRSGAGTAAGGAPASNPR